MPQLVKKRRSGWAVLAVCALVASILAVGTGAVSAQPASTITAASPNHNPDAGADWSACVGAAGTHDAMFSDVSEDNVHADAINCIAYYGVTVGMGDGTYGPDANVSAFEMRLFVQRTADRMGADGEAVLAGVELSDPVTRLEMAQLMFGLVDDISDDVRISPADGQIQFYDDDTNAWVVVDDFFADAKAQVPIFESQVVGAAYELGITRGTKGDGTLVSTPNSTFDPFANVDRAEMASFIARTLDHSNLRPEGLSIQRNSNRDTMVSLRDADWGAIEDARIDVFSALYPDDAFDPDDGECEGNFVKDETPSHSTCAIDIGDQLTDDEGNVQFTLVSDSDPITAACAADSTAVLRFESAPGSAGRTFWAWTGDLDDEVSEDTHLQELEDVARPVGKAGPDYARVSGGLPTGDELAKMGETVNFTVQLYSQAGDAPNADKDTAVGPDRSRNPYHLRVQKFWVARVADTDSDADGAAGSATGDGTDRNGMFAEAPGQWNFTDARGTSVETAAAARPFNTPVDTVVWPNGDGELVIPLTNPDVNAAPAVNNTDVGVHFTLTPFIAGNDFISANLVTDLEAKGNYVADADDVTAAGGVDVATGYVIFSDDASDPHAVSGETAEYRITAGGRTGNSVTVSVVDQYGDGMRNVAVSVSSNLDVIAPTDAAPDEVVYPEEVDVTVQTNEDRDGDATDDDPNTGARGETTDFVRSTNRDSYFTFTVGTLNTATPTGTRSKIEVNDTRAIARTPDTIGEDDVEGTFSTRRNGTYRVGYTYIGDDAKTEMITPESIETRSLAIDDNDTPNDHTDDTGSAPTVRAQEVGSAVSVYWTDIGSTRASSGGRTDNAEFLPVLVRDVANRTIVVNEPDGTDIDDPMAYFYDEDDTFIIAGVGATFEMFEEALSATYKDDDIYVDYVSWENYSITRPGRVNRTIWELTLSCTDPGDLRLNTNSGEAGNEWISAG